MNAPNRARPCPLCEVVNQGLDVVVGLYREEAFAEHVLRDHPGFDARSVWAMPMPRKVAVRESAR